MRSGPKFGLPEYPVWAAMVQRCTNPKDKSWDRYGGRGIAVCDSWKKFDNFYRDMGSRPLGHSLDRINNDGAYETANCRWATLSEQANNKRRYVRNMTGVSGIAYRAEIAKFRVYTFRGGQKTAGHFVSLDDAIHAKVLAEWAIDGALA